MAQIPSLTDEIEWPVLLDVLVDLEDDADDVGVDGVQVQGQPRPVQVAPYPVHLLKSVESVKVK